MERLTRLGVLTPSSNTALEPLTSAIVHQVPGASAHFSRFSVTEIGLDARASRQFDIDTVVAAARLLADARVDVIGWSGTSAGWLGFDRDQALCEAIQHATDIPATTSVLALNEIMHIAGIERFALFTPYTDDVQQRIVANYRTRGPECVAERHLGIRVNFEFAEVLPGDIRAGCLALLEQSDAQAVVTLCTNLRAANLADDIESSGRGMLLDTVSTVIWKMLALSGRDPGAIRGFGKLFGVPAH